MKYEEQPIDDSKGPEQFSVGDQVAYYDGMSEPFQGEIEGFGVNRKRLVIPIAGEKLFIHWKQCRKLVEKKPREWLLCDHCKTTRDLGYMGCHCGVTPMIKVREVLE